MKSKTSTGCDNISSKLLKELANVLGGPISILINKSMESGIVPKSMKTAKVIPIFKSKDKTIFTNYRPISLLPALSKVLEKVIHKRVYYFLQSKDIYYLKANTGSERGIQHHMQ